MFTVEKLRERLTAVASEYLALRPHDLADLLHELDSPLDHLKGPDSWYYRLLRIATSVGAVDLLFQGPRAYDRELLLQINLWANARPALNPLAARLAKRAEPVPVVVAGDRQSTRTHALKRRGDALAAVLNVAKTQALDGENWPSVWASLVSLAKSANRPPPLLGYTEGEGVKYQTDNAETPVGWLTREAYRGRFRRQP